MELIDEIYVGKSIYDARSAIELLKAGKKPSGIFCVCKKKAGKFLYEIISSAQLAKDGDSYVVYGIAAGKMEAFELVRYIVEDRHEY